MTNTTYSIQEFGTSRSFPEDDAFLAGSQQDGEVLVVIGDEIRVDVHALGCHKAVAVELGDDCLSVHTGGCETPETSNVIGFSRWRLGNNEPSNLVELVVEPGAKAEAIAAARHIFESAGLVVSVCADRSGRIVDRLIRPQFNLALRAVDDGLATPEDIENCLKLGLGYRNGILEPLLDSGLAHHYDVTSMLFKTYGQAQYAPPRQAVVAKKRQAREGEK